MLRVFLRFVGVLALAVAFAALVVDGTRSVANGTVVILPLDQSAAAVFPVGFEAFHKSVEMHAPELWTAVLVPIMRLPGWLVFGIIGIVLFALTRRRAPKIGYSRR